MASTPQLMVIASKIGRVKPREIVSGRWERVHIPRIEGNHPYLQMICKSCQPKLSLFRPLDESFADCSFNVVSMEESVLWWQDVESVYSRILDENIIIYKHAYELTFRLWLGQCSRCGTRLIGESRNCS